MNKLMMLVLVMIPVVATAEPRYTFASRSLQTVQTETPAPEGYVRVETDGWGEWLRGLPVLPEGSPVLKEDGTPKPNQRAHHRVINMPVLPYQECADSVMRLRAEYLVSAHKTFRFSGMSFSKGSRGALDRFLRRLFVMKGTLNLASEMTTPPAWEGRVQPGDVLVRGGSPGHAVMVLDVVQNGRSRKLLLGNGFMPAQQFHVLRNPKGGVWFDEAELYTPAGLRIPLAGITFNHNHLRRF